MGREVGFCDVGGDESEGASPEDCVLLSGGEVPRDLALYLYTDSWR
jgi:hypothetical protein